MDGSGFRWEGLGNSGTRWMGLLRYGLATDHAIFLQLQQDCGSTSSRASLSSKGSKGSNAADAEECNRFKAGIDPGIFVTGWGGFDWHWGHSTSRRVQAAMAARGETELELNYRCWKRWHRPGLSERAPSVSWGRAMLQFGLSRTARAASVATNVE